MTTSFTLTKEMREKVVDQLTVQAVAKHAKKIAAALTKLNKDFWQQHIDNVAAILQVDRERWPELIQAGVIAATSQATPKSSGESCPIHFAKAGWNDKPGEALEETRRLVIRSETFAGAFAHLNFDSYRTLELRLRCPEGSVPRLNSFENLPSDSSIIKKALSINDQMKAVFAAAHEFRQQAADILNSCRTSRQLVELFPEAAKLLPEPVKRNTELAPVELVQSVRDKLTNGIPSIADAN